MFFQEYEKENVIFSDNPGKKCVDFFTFQYNFSSPQVKRDQIHHQKVNVRVVPRVAEQFKTLKLKKIPEMLEFDGKYPVDHPKAVKHSTEKYILLNFAKLSTTPCVRLQVAIMAGKG